MSAIRKVAAPALSIVTAAATKSAKSAKSAKSTVTAKPAAGRVPPKAPVPKATWDMGMIARMADAVVHIAGVQEFRDRLAADIKFFRDNKLRLGKSRRTCGVSQAFFDSFVAQGVKDSTATTYVTALRYAINDGTPFTLNKSRDDKRAAAKKAGKTGKNAAKTSWKTTGEVLDALAKAIRAVQDAAGDTLWTQAMDMTPFGFADSLSEFMAAQADEETEEAEAN